MYKEILQNIAHIALWPLISFVIFFLFFIVLLWWAITADKKFIRQMSELPLEDGTNSDQPIKTERP